MVGSLGFLGELATSTEANAPRASCLEDRAELHSRLIKTSKTDYSSSSKVGARRTRDLIVFGHGQKDSDKVITANQSLVSF